jgi:hypothetical protein
MCSPFLIVCFHGKVDLIRKGMQGKNNKNLWEFSVDFLGLKQVGIFGVEGWWVLILGHDF